MPFKSLNDLTQEVIVELSMVPGTATQRYADDRIARMVVRAYQILSRKMWWPHQTQWYSRALSGTDGLITTVLAEEIEFRDIDSVYAGNNTRKLALLPQEWNPYVISGTSPRYVEAYNEVEGKPLRIWPLEATGNIRIRARSIEPFTTLQADATIRFDDATLVNYVAWKIAEDDGASPAQAARLQLDFKACWDQLLSDTVAQPVELDPRYPYDTDQYQEVD